MTMVLNVMQSLKLIYYFEFEILSFGKEPYLFASQANQAFMLRMLGSQRGIFYINFSKRSYNMPEAVMDDDDVFNLQVSVTPVTLAISVSLSLTIRLDVILDAYLKMCL